MTQPRIVSLVPSWTETLVRAQAHVVGRTRFCIHTGDQVKIPIVGGTKDLNIETLKKIKPDFILLDREENTQEMVQALNAEGLRWVSTHVKNFKTCAEGLVYLAQVFELDILQLWVQQYQDIDSGDFKINRTQFWKKLILSWINCDEESFFSNLRDLPDLEYLIWKKPWMAVGPQTFIGQHFEKLNYRLLQGLSFDSSVNYPQIELPYLENKICLFSSEPYPFAKKIKEIQKLPLKGAVVDGELLSWFGIRNLDFLIRSM